VKVSEADLAKIKPEPCTICDSDLEFCHQAAQDYAQLTLDLHRGLLATPVGRRMFGKGRLVVYFKDGVRTPGILLQEGAKGGSNPFLHVLEIRTRRDQRDSTDLLPYLPKYRKLFTKLPQYKKHISTKTLQIPFVDLICLTTTIVKGVLPGIFNGGEDYLKAKEELARICTDWEEPQWDELDYSRIKDLQLRDILAKRVEQSVISQKASCLQCPQLVKHVSVAIPSRGAKLTLIVRNVPRSMAHQGEHLPTTTTYVRSEPAAFARLRATYPSP
jgi:antiviral helicase SKI2